MLDIDDRNDGRVRILTLNRPEALNAFDTALYDAGAAALRDASADETVRCVVITGTGRAFSAGQDLAEMGRIAASDGPAGEPAAMSERDGKDGGGNEEGAGHGFPRFLDALMTFEKPLIAAVNGLGVGIGFTMLLHCDVVVLAHAARLRAPFVPLGVVPEASGSVLMPAVMGNQRASYFLYTGKWMSADDAIDAGIAYKAVPDGELMHEVLAIADDIAKMPTVSLVESKRLAIAARIDAVRAANLREQEVFSRLAGAPANMEAITAFLEKRDPVF